MNLAPILAAGVSSVEWQTFWPYFTGGSLLLVGVVTGLRKGKGHFKGLEGVVALAPAFLAASIGVFGIQHFTAPDAMTALVPKWLPAPVFWTYFVGTALVVGPLGVVARKASGLAAALLGVLMWSFVLFIWLPGFVRNPGSRLAMAVFFRETTFGAGCFALAVWNGFGPLAGRSRDVLRLMMLLVGLATLVFGLEHFLHPTLEPVVPLENDMPGWIPARPLIGVLTGIVLVASGANLVLNRKARVWATRLGTFTVAIVVLVYVPILIATPGVQEGLNPLADTLLFAGAVLCLAGALPREARTTAE